MLYDLDRMFHLLRRLPSKIVHIKPQQMRQDLFERAVKSTTVKSTEALTARSKQVFDAYKSELNSLNSRRSQTLANAPKFDELLQRHVKRQGITVFLVSVLGTLCAAAYYEIFEKQPEQQFWDNFDEKAMRAMYERQKSKNIFDGFTDED